MKVQNLGKLSLTFSTINLKEEVNETVCSCIYKTRSNHCDAFKYFNTTIPAYSIYEIGRI